LLAEVGAGLSGGGVVSRLAQLQERVGQIEQWIARLRGQRESLQQERLDEAEATQALAGLDPAWDTMTPQEQARLVGLLVSRVDYDGARGKVSITFHRASANTSRTQKCAHADKCQYIPNRAISPGSRGWAADSPLRGSAADWSAPCVAG
jgi:hypothetical protein